MSGQEKQIIYVVTSGSYSAYGINAVFTDKALAEAFVRDFSKSSIGDAYDIEEYEANNPGIDGWAPGLLPWLAEIAENGDIERLERHTSGYAGDSTWFGFPQAGGPVCLRTRFLARDEDHARKIAGERWAQVKASRPWGMDEDGRMVQECRWRWSVPIMTNIAVAAKEASK